MISDRSTNGVESSGTGESRPLLSTPLGNAPSITHAASVFGLIQQIPEGLQPLDNARFLIQQIPEGLQLVARGRVRNADEYPGIESMHVIRPRRGRSTGRVVGVKPKTAIETTKIKKFHEAQRKMADRKRGTATIAPNNQKSKCEHRTSNAEHPTLNKREKDESFSLLLSPLL